MFEGALKSASPRRSDEAGALRAVAWPDLVAQFAAARDLRAIFASGSRQTLASFAPGAACALASCAYAERDVNPDALTDGKAPGTTSAFAAGYPRDGDREMQ